MEVKITPVCLMLLLFCDFILAAETAEARPEQRRQDGQLSKYLDYLEKVAPSDEVCDCCQLIPALKFGNKTRLVLDIGQGAGSVGAALANRSTLTLSIAAKRASDSPTIPTGHPVLDQEFSTHRLPYSSQAFDLLHCAACNITWHSNGGLFLLEADRILRGGGYFVYTKQPGSRAGWKELVMLAGSICWNLVVKEDGLWIWQKPNDVVCNHRTVSTVVNPCNNSTTIPRDAAWNVALQPCLAGHPERVEVFEGDWKLRILNPPARLKDVPAAGIEEAKAEAYEADTNYWRMITAFYLRAFGPSRIHDVCNVIDMNAGYGGFAAAVALQNSSMGWWVLSVIPVNGPDRLPVILDRGLLGIYHDWCEALEVQPNTFDMVHSSRLFASPQRCPTRDIVYEMHRLLRPGGFALIREQLEVIVVIRDIAESLHWKTRVEDTESGPMGKDKLLHCQKTSWRFNDKKT